MTFAHQYQSDLKQQPAESSGAQFERKVKAVLDEGALACHTVAGHPKKGGSGSTAFTADELLDVSDLCRHGCTQVADFMAIALSRSLQPAQA